MNKRRVAAWHPGILARFRRLVCGGLLPICRPQFLCQLCQNGQAIFFATVVRLNAEFYRFWISPFTVSPWTKISDASFAKANLQIAGLCRRCLAR